MATLPKSKQRWKVQIGYKGYQAVITHNQKNLESKGKRLKWEW